MMLKTLADRIKYFGCFKSNSGAELTDKQKSWLLNLQENGYTLINDLIDKDNLEQLQKLYSEEVEKKLNFETPCVSQEKIDAVQHQHLIENHFKYTNQRLEEEGITFTESECESYSHVLSTFKPSTLKTYIPDNSDFLKLWLHPEILKVIEAYMGLRPHMVEAYLRRNFPADHKVMNHHWHRDANNKDYLLKVFIFFSDCNIYHGPHEYIAGSIDDTRLNGKDYYTDEEVDSLYPQGSERRIQSVVKAGTIIVEDTRGLHRARIPEKEFRDLGYAVFMPRRIFHKYDPQFYSVSKEVFNTLDNVQKSYIPNEFIVESLG